MSDLLAGFTSQQLQGDGAEIFVRTGGSGPALLLIHGYPQTGAMWHRLAPALAERFSVVIPDIRGYGRSSSPPADNDHYNYSKRAMGRDLFAVMSAMGHDRFLVCGHDRGARVAYRMALEEPGRIVRLSTLDIVPTHDTWLSYDADFAMDSYHWLFLAQPHPLPEKLISADPEFYLDWTLASWTGTRDLTSFDETALNEYRAAWRDESRIHAACNDYRSGWHYDWPADRTDLEAGRKITCPVLVLWGSHGLPGRGSRGPLDVWKNWAGDVRGAPIEAGHFLAEENPAATLDHLLPFLLES